jgi:DICT domain-containing protein
MDISLFRSIASQYKHLRRINTIPMMNVISHQIEDQIIQYQLSANFFVGFQRFSNFPDQLRRYSRLGSICRRVYVFGVADYQPPPIPGIEYIDIAPTSALAHERFLLIDTPDYWVTLVAQEIEGQDPLTGGRRFDSLWSFDQAVVDRISLLMSQVMEVPYQPILQRDHSRQSGHISEISSRMLGALEHSELSGQHRWVQLRTLQGISEMAAKTPIEVLQDAARILHNIFGAAGVVIALRTTGDHYTVAVVEGEANGRGWKIPLSSGLIGQVIRQGRVVQITDVNHRMDNTSLFPTAKTMISAPIVNRRIHGAVAIGSPELNWWNDEDAQTIKTFARLLAVYLEQALSIGQNKVAPIGPISKIRV